MNTFKSILIVTGSVVLFSCVSSRKYKDLNAEYRQLNSIQADCSDKLKKEMALSADLNSLNSSLQAQVDYLKNNSSQVLGALQDMSVLSQKQAESVKQSLESMSQKDMYINNLQAAIARKDSLNINLVMNLKSSLKDINDKDINIKVEKGVVYIDISDKLLFNSGKYAVTDNAKTVLGKVANVLEAWPEIEFIVEGHTDNVPIHSACIDDNWDLSVKRATSVVRILQDEFKIDPSRMTASGRSTFVPVASNETDEGRAQNRRTRIIILPQLDQFFKLMVRK